MKYEFYKGFHWGKALENGVWIGPVPQWRLMFRNHDALYIAAGWLRLRLMRRSPQQTGRTK